MIKMKLLDRLLLVIAELGKFEKNHCSEMF